MVDVDGDMRVDVLSASFGDNRIAWYKNGGGSPPTWTPYTISSVASGARSVYAADVDGDGRMDVLSASYNDNKIALYTNIMCPRGTSGPGGYAPCTACSAGRFSNDSLQSSCIMCPAGRYGTVAGAVNTASGCAGACSPGYFSGPGASACTTCPPYTASTLAGANACLSACPVPGQLTVGYAGLNTMTPVGL